MRITGRRLAVAATMLLVALIAPLGGGTAQAATTQCPRDVLRQVGLTVGGEPRFAELPPVFTNYVVKRPRVRNYCLIDVWTVPETGWYTERYLMVVKVRSAKIVAAYNVDTLGAAAPHDWTPDDYRGLKVPAANMETAAFGMICWGYPEIQGIAIFKLIKRVAGYMPDVYCS